MNDLDFERTIYSRPAEISTAGTLFDTFADQVLRRVDEAIAGRGNPWPLQAYERQFLQLIRQHGGKSRTVPLGRLAEALHTTPRHVKDIVQTLRLDFRIGIGASRDGDAGGYYLLSTQDEAVESSEQMFRQAVTMLRVVAAMRGGTRAIAVLLTQLNLALEAVHE